MSTKKIGHWYESGRKKILRDWKNYRTLSLYVSKKLLDTSKQQFRIFLFFSAKIFGWSTDLKVEIIANSNIHLFGLKFTMAVLCFHGLKKIVINNFGYYEDSKLLWRKFWTLFIKRKMTRHPNCYVRINNFQQNFQLYTLELEFYWISSLSGIVS